MVAPSNQSFPPSDSCFSAIDQRLDSLAADQTNLASQMKAFQAFLDRQATVASTTSPVSSPFGSSSSTSGPSESVAASVPLPSIPLQQWRSKKTRRIATPSSSSPSSPSAPETTLQLSLPRILSDVAALRDYGTFRNSPADLSRTTGAFPYISPHILRHLISEEWFEDSNITNFIHALRKIIAAHPDRFPYDPQSEILPLFNTDTIALRHNQFEDYIDRHCLPFRPWDDLDFVLLPMFVTGHFIALRIDLTRCCLYLYDSLGKGSLKQWSESIHRLRQCLNAAFISLRFFEWRGQSKLAHLLPLHVAPHVPQQDDSTSCGPYVCYFLLACSQHLGSTWGLDSPPLDPHAAREMVSHLLFHFREPTS